MSHLPELHATLVNTFTAGTTFPLAWRLTQLRAALRMLQDNREAWLTAVHRSTLKPVDEVVLAEYANAVAELSRMISEVAAWARPKDVATPLSLLPAASREERQPYGVTLIVGPFNYPLNLVFLPLCGALAAGCPAVLKPSEASREVADLFEQLVPAYLDTDAVRVCCGGAATMTALLALRWDHIIFTGSERVGKIVAAAAARHLTPTTLELGGKCPVILDGEHPVDLQVRRDRGLLMISASFT